MLLTHFDFLKGSAINQPHNHLQICPEDDKDTIIVKENANNLLNSLLLLINCMSNAIKQVEQESTVTEIKIIKDICANKFSSTSSQCKYSTCEKTALAYKRKLIENIYFKTITEIGKATGVHTEIINALVVPFPISRQMTYNDIFTLYPIIKKNLTYNYFNCDDEFLYNIFQEEIIEANVDFIKTIESVMMIIKTIDPIAFANTPVYLGSARKRTFSPSQTALCYKNLFKQKTELVTSLELLLWLFKQSNILI